MGARLRSWWQQIKKHRAAIRVVALVLIAVVVIALIIAVVLFNGTGFNGYTVKSTATETTLSPQTKVTTTTQSQPGKTLWDLLQLLAALAIPVVVGFGAAWFTAQQGKVGERENKDNQREKALQDYIDKIAELLLKEHLDERTADGKLKPEYEQVRNIARVRTITVLTQLDARRIGYVFAFLREAGLMSTTSNNDVVILGGANFRSVNWSQADLGYANLSHAFLQLANLRLANLNDANLSGATLLGANLSYATLGYANLSHAFLGYANLSSATLNNANLNDANLSSANLSHAILFNADLSRADLSEANLSGVYLIQANLSGAKVTEEQLKEAKSLEGATMPDGTKHP